MSVRLPAHPILAARVVSTALVLALVGGCAVVPDVPGPRVSVADVRSTFDRDVTTPAASSASASASVPEVEALVELPNRVRWGGTIASVRNTADGTTVLEVVSRPLMHNGRPRSGDVTDGRFLAEVDRFLDPEIVTAGRDVTIVGSLKGDEIGSIGELRYRFPVVSVDDFHYWKPPAPVRHFPHTLAHGGHFHGFFHDWPHALHHHHQPRSARLKRRWATGAIVHFGAPL